MSLPKANHAYAHAYRQIRGTGVGDTSILLWQRSACAARQRMQAGLTDVG